MSSAPEPLGLDELPSIGPAAVCMGVFDGVHRGHQAMLIATRQAARLHGAAAVALVFEPHPDEVLKQGLHVPRLAPLQVTLDRLERHGIGHALPIRFDDELRSLSAEDFIGALEPAITLRDLVMSSESAFGRGRGGTVARMRTHGREGGFEVVTVEPVIDAGEPVSSSRIRAAVAAGDLATARRLGVPAFLQGVVIDGDHRGRELGYPTANLRFDYTPAMPPLGIYTGRVAVSRRRVGPGHPALVSIGVRPTFHDEGRVLVEVHLLDYDGDLYGALLDLELLDRIREERRFAGAEELVAQMRLDEAEARLRLGPG
jgi:riboflavin kinase / FMN adenylyltransferase